MLINAHLVALVLCGIGLGYALLMHSLLWLIYFCVLAALNGYVVRRELGK